MAISKLNGTIPKGFTDPINVKFANTPNPAKSIIGLPLAPSYLSTIPNSQAPVLATVPSIRQTLNRYRYAAELRSYFALCFFLHYDFAFFPLEKRASVRNIGENFS